DERLIGEAHRAFRNGVHVAGEAEGGEIIEEVLPEAPGLLQPGDLCVRKAQRLEIIERIGEPRRQQKTAPGRQAPHEEFEYGLLILAAVQVGLDHVEFIEVGNEGTGGGRHDASLSRAACARSSQAVLAAPGRSYARPAAGHSCYIQSREPEICNGKSSSPAR